MYRTIFIDQCGYLCDGRKQVTFRADAPVDFTVCQTDGTIVYRACADTPIQNASAKETNYIGDFSAVSTPGRYYIVTQDNHESETFEISTQPYQDVFQKSMAFFYLQSCGRELPDKAAGIYGHCACHTTSARSYDDPSITKDVTGGWHDAGDYGRYVGPGAMAAAQLLYAWERNQKLCESYECPDSDTEVSLPAYLAEVKVELDWMCKMQRPDGAVYHKATCYHFCDFIMPQEEKEPIILSPVSVTATGDFAAVCALAARIYDRYDSDYAAKLKEASKKAYAAMKEMDIPGGFQNPKEITTGEYGDKCDLDERYWAAAELYRTFGDARYHDDFKALAREKIYHGYGWADMGSYGNLAYLGCEYPTDPDIRSAIREDISALANMLLAVANEDGYGTALKSTEYIWGSNMNVANNGLHLYDAYCITRDTRYLDAAADQLHYLLGRNPMGLCYITGCGTNAIKHPHHRPSGFLGKAMPGMLSGGPCDWLADACAKGILTSDTAPAKALIDMTGSYSTNEVTIYWNSAFLQLLASVLSCY